MARYVAGRLLWGLLIVWAVSVVVFVIFTLLPAGDPAVNRAGERASPAQVEAVRSALGFDRSVFVQYGLFVRDLVLDRSLGYSYESGVPVNELIGDRLPATLFLILGSMIVWLGVGVGLGVSAASRPRSWLDRIVGSSSLVLVALPVFVLGYVALLLFSSDSGSLLPVLPGIGSYVSADGMVEKLAALLLPCLVLGLSSAAVYARLTRSVVTDELARPYVTAARSRGLGRQRVLWGHATRTGMPPVLTLLGIDLGLILAGNVVLVEVVFNVPGIGSLLVNAVDQSDLPVVQGVTMLAAVTVVLANIVVDVIYAALDPRVKLQRA